MKNFYQILTLFFIVVFSLTVAGASQNLILDLQSVYGPLTLQPTDAITYSTLWQECDRITITATDNTTLADTPVFAANSPEEGTTRWNYTVQGLDSDHTFTLRHTSLDGVEVVKEYEKVVSIIPEPIFWLFLLAPLGFFFGRKQKLFLVLFFAFIFEATTAWAEVTNLRVSQRFPWSGEVDIVYTLANDAGHTNGFPIFEMTFKALWQGTEKNLTVTGDGANGFVFGTGKKRAVWNAALDFPSNFVDEITVSVTAVDKTSEATYMRLNTEDGTFSFAATAPASYSYEDKTKYLWLRQIPAGTFYMGSSATEIGRFDNETRHQVTLTKPFFIGVFEVTQKQAKNLGWNLEYYFVGDMQPVEMESWEQLRGNHIGSAWPASGVHTVDTNSFLDLARRKFHGLLLDLPTEAQWEYACRAGHGDGYWNDGSLILKAWEEDANLNNLGWNYFISTNATHVVGSKNPNDFGLYDCHGNVFEWCLDWYLEDLGTAAVVDPVGPMSSAEASRPYRLIRGGSYDINPRQLRSAYRYPYYTAPPYTSFELGVRLVLLLDEE